MPNKDQVLKK